MPSFCAVLGCTDKYGHSRTVPFHKFPTKNKELLEKWIHFVGKKDWRPSKWTTVCGQHFRDEDYRCAEQKKMLKKTAVPSVRAAKYDDETATTKPKEKPIDDDDSNCMNFEQEESNNDSNSECTTKLAATPHKHEQVNVKCRFCGSATTNYESFACNFEIYGIIQKCLPTLSIRQDDEMPKELCFKCLKCLENFALFIDKVLETQTTLQRQFRQEKGGGGGNVNGTSSTGGGGGTKPIERALKIKQEPFPSSSSCVRVKQENFEDVNALFHDEADDNGEQENENSINDSEQLDQKIQFCDFPMLNDQDIINNCDIMEIINLSDPFIDITNCENTLADEEQQQQQPLITTHANGVVKKLLQSAHELLQSHLLIEEHNYANANNEDFKGDWQFKNCYKTEKIEAEDYDEDVVGIATQAIEQIDMHLDEFLDEANAAEDVAAITTVETTILPLDDGAAATADTERSIKPIVTSVSSFNDGSLGNYTPAAAVFVDETFQRQQQRQQQLEQKPSPATSSRKRPNIVVLNESIVQSSHTFQLQACTICQSKFIGVDSLAQHYATAHAMAPPPPTQKAPMVTVPTANLTQPLAWQNNQSTHPPQQQQQQQTPHHQQQHQQFQPDQICKNEIDGNFALTSSCQRINDGGSTISNINLINKRSAKNEIKILDMQQSFLHHPHHHHQQYNYQPTNLIHFEQQSNLNFHNAPQFAYPLQTQTQTPETTTAAPPFSQTNNPNINDQSGNGFVAQTISQQSSNQLTINQNASRETIKDPNCLETNIGAPRSNTATAQLDNTNEFVDRSGGANSFISANVMQPTNKANKQQQHHHNFQLNSPATKIEDLPANRANAATNQRSIIKSANKISSQMAASDNVDSSQLLTLKYKALQKSYARLRLKCQRLTSKNFSKSNISSSNSSTKQQKTLKSKLRFNCRICNCRFRTIQQLLRHRQTAGSDHQTKPKRHFQFFASCPGCEKFFCRKVALFNHMRYICQSLPLSWFKSHLRSFKCRYCRLITFTHWRLYRRHEIHCRRKRRKLKAKSTTTTTSTPTKPKATTTIATSTTKSISHKFVTQSSKNAKASKATSQHPASSSNSRLQQHSNRGNRSKAPYKCDICQKFYPSSSCLRQHRITHSNLRSFECEICKRNFKRRNGLTQHVRGYHLKLKPYECAVCKRSYALKGDVKRCKHSAIQRSKSKRER